MKIIKQAFPIIILFFSYCIGMEKGIESENIEIGKTDIKKDFVLKKQNKLNDWLFLKQYFPKLASELKYYIVKTYIASVMRERGLNIRKKLKGLSLISKEFELFVESLLKDKDLIESELWQRMLLFEKLVRNNSKTAIDLIKAAKDNDLYHVYYYLLAGINPNEQDYHEQNTPLIIASAKGYKEIVELLISSEAQLELYDHEGSTALMAAVYNGRKEIMKLLLDAGADINCEGLRFDSPLIVAINANYLNNDQVVRSSAEADKLRYEIIEILLKRKATINKRNYYGDTALIFASAKGYRKIVKLLLNFKAKINYRNNNRDTALIEAARNGHRKIVKLLLNHGAKVIGKNIKGETALKVAKKGKYTEIQNLLIAYGAKDTKLNRVINFLKN